MKLERPLKNKLMLSNFFFFLFLVFAGLGFIGPKWGMEYAPREFRRGLDAVFAIDISRSMDIQDAGSTRTQSRLERGLFIAKESITQAPGARFAVAIGRGKGYLAVPLTYDNFSTQIFMESIDTSSMSGRSTNLEALVEAAIDAFQETSPARKVIVLISDGESHAGILRNTINRCVKDGIILCAVAVGSDEGRQIPERANDLNAQTVVSRRDAAVLRAAAERTGGIYIDGSRDDAGSVLGSHLLSLSHEMENATGRKEPKQQRPLFVILALLAYAASIFVTRQSYSAQKKIYAQTTSTGTSLFILIFALTASSSLFISCSEGKLLLIEANYLNSRGRHDEALLSYLKALNDENAAPYAEYGLGLTFYQMDNSEAALQRYEDSKKLLEKFPESEHRELRFRNHYNSGVALFEEGDYHSAADSFRDALRADPRKLDAKRNLELSLLSAIRETSSSTENRTVEQEEQREIIFEMLKQEEQQLWKSREWAPEEDFTGADY